MRFVHVADVHLDTSFAGRSSSVRRRLREASREAFRRAVDLAIREDVHAFLVAGDLFDGERLSFQTERFLLEQVHRLGDNGITMVYATGNHDPGAAGTGPRSLEWPPNVCVAGDDTPRRIAIQSREGVPVGFVVAVGHATDRETADLSRLLPRPGGTLPEVALLHTQVHSSLGAGEHHAYAPSDLTYLIRSGYDYWALGHVHVRQMLAQDPPVAYPGSLQGRTHADQGPRGALLVDLSNRDDPVVSFRPLAPVRWETITVGELEASDSLDRLERRVEAAWRAAPLGEAGRSDVEWMVRVVLEGPCPLWKELRAEEDLDVLAGELREMLGVLDVVVQADRIHPVIPVEEHRARTDVLGEALRLLDKVRRGEVGLTGLEPDALAGLGSDGGESLDAYVRRILEGADAELAARMLGEGEKPA
jgi:DNA repair exonuclease SbcCD nuclease subunit